MFNVNFSTRIKHFLNQFFNIINFGNQLLDTSGDPIWNPGDLTWGHDPEVKEQQSKNVS